MNAAIVMERNAIAPAPPAVRARRSFKRPALAALGLAALLGIARYANNWWTTGRFIETTDDAYIGDDVTQIAPHVAGFISRILVRDNRVCPRRPAPDPSGPRRLPGRPASR
jgi:membrane fusion protein, multidrug efflux system